MFVQRGRRRLETRFRLEAWPADESSPRHSPRHIFRSNQLIKIGICFQASYFRKSSGVQAFWRKSEEVLQVVQQPSVFALSDVE
jgi:hypothetical protein